MNNNIPTLPINIKYKDNIDLSEKLLEIFSLTTYNLTERNKDILKVCLIEDVIETKLGDDRLNFLNISHIKDILTGMEELGFKNRAHATTEINRVVKAGLLTQHKFHNKYLLPKPLESMRQLVQVASKSDNGEISYNMIFSKK